MCIYIYIINVILRTALRGRYCHPNLMSEETKSEMGYPISQSVTAKLRFRPRQPNPRAESVIALPSDLESEHKEIEKRLKGQR